MKIAPSSGSPLSAASCALANALPNESEMPITSPVERISGPRIGSNSRNLLNGNTASFTETYGGTISSVKPMSSSVSPQHHARGERRERDADRLRHERDRAAGARIHLEHVDHAVLDRVLHVDQADDAERLRERDGVLAHRRRGRCSPIRYGGSTHAESPEWMPGVLDVLHDAADHDALAVGDRVDVGLERVLEEAVDEHRPVLRHARRACRSSPRSDGCVVHDLHRAAAEHVRRPHEHRDSRSAPRPRPLRRRSSPCRSAAA